MDQTATMIRRSSDVGMGLLSKSRTIKRAIAVTSVVTVE
jgi:hypothetical protein